VRPWPLLLRRGAARLADAIRPGAGKVTIGYQLRRFLRAAALPTAEAHFSWNGTWMPDVAAGFAASPGAARAAREALTGLAARHALGSSPGLFDLQRADIGDYLPNDILAKVDRMTMAHGLEARAPLLTPAVAEFALSLPDDLKVQARGQPKRLLRDLATRLYGPEIGAAKKQGFSIPIHDWLRGPARELTRDLLSDASVRRSGLLNPTAVTAAVEAHFAGRDQLGFELWGLMVLVAWARTMAASTPLTAADPLPRLTFDRVAMASANP
jgi:asparagine synthase (glutamine-hydrolysing)